MSKSDTHLYIKFGFNNVLENYRNTDNKKIEPIYLISYTLIMSDGTVKIGTFDYYSGLNDGQYPKRSLLKEIARGYVIESKRSLINEILITGMSKMTYEEWKKYKEE